MAANILNLNKPFKCKAVYFTDDREPIKDCDIYITDRFLVISQGEQNTSPEEAPSIDWVNLDFIKGLEGVTVPPPKPITRSYNIW